MNRNIRKDTTTYKVVVNHEEQYSIWPAARKLTPGWRDTRKRGTKQECEAYVKDVARRPKPARDK